MTKNERIVSDIERTTPNRQIAISRHQLLRAIADADRALDGDSNDYEHDALSQLRTTIAGWAGNIPERVD